MAPDEQVAGEHLLGDGRLAAVAELDDVLHRNDDLVDPLLEVHRGDAGLEVLANLLLIARLGVYDEPLSGAVVGTLHRCPSLNLLVEEFVLADDDGCLLDYRGVLADRVGDRLEAGRVGLGHRRVDRAGGQQVGDVLDGEFGFFVDAHQTSNSSRMELENSQSRPATRTVTMVMVITTTIV